MILSVSEPVWDKTIRKWRIFYKIDDKDVGVYEQEVQAEAKISADRARSAILQVMQKERSK